MNITNDSAGFVTQKHILNRGFKIYKINEVNDMGQGTYELPQYERADGVKITGGYWSYNIEDSKGNVLFDGWWNSNKEFDETMIHIDYLVKYQPNTSKYERLKKEYDKLISYFKEQANSDLSLSAVLIRFELGIQTEADIKIMSARDLPNQKTVHTEYGDITIINHESFNKR
jgi:hypothetical protein